MRAFEHGADGRLMAQVEPEEATMLSELASQIVGLVTAGPADRLAREADDPALRRLLPDAYPDDAGASAEFRRFTVDGLVERKVANAVALIASLSEAAEATAPTEVRLDPAAVQAWLRCLTDMRLVLAERLEITDDDPSTPAPAGRSESNPPDAAAAMLRDVYDWLGLVQESLLHAIDG